jgi:hypothetical protein
LCKDFDGSFYNEDYFERGCQSGKGWSCNYHWMPKRTFREAFAFIDYFPIPDDAYILDVGGAKGFIVRALQELEYKADVCDISEYALKFAPLGSWNCTTKESWISHSKTYTHAISKDVFEHLTVPKLYEMMENISLVSSRLMTVIPMGDNGKYRIPEYHNDISHNLAENEEWWYNQFKKCGWKVIKDCAHLKGLKDNWFHYETGNRVFVLEKI